MVEPKGTGRTTKTAAAAAKANATNLNTTRTAPSSNDSSSKDNSIMDNIDSIDSDMTDRELLIRLCGKVDKLTNFCEGVEATIGKMSERITETEKRIQSQEKTIMELTTKLTSLEKEVKANAGIAVPDMRIRALESIQEDMYCEANEPNVIIRGLNMTSQKNFFSQVSDLFRDLHAARRPRIQKVRKLGNKLLVRFPDNSEKEFLYSKIRTLQRYGISIEDDLPPSIRRDRSILLQKRREVLDNGSAKTVKVLRRSIILDGKEIYDLNRQTGIVEKRKSVNQPR
jgi:hypothetical protein